MADGKEVIDYAVVGGGIAGLYCCFHLQKMARGKKIHLYEASDRLGGRIQTWRIDPFARKSYASASETRDRSTAMLEEDKRERERLPSAAVPTPKPLDEIYPAEFGPMRVEPDQQPYLHKLLDELGIKEPPREARHRQERWSDLVPFSPYRGAPPNEPAFNLEDEEGEQTDTIDLLLLALRRVFEILQWPEPSEKKPWLARKDLNHHWQEFRKDTFLNCRFWKRSLREWINHLEEDQYNVLRKAKFQGTRLCDMGFWNLMGAVMTHMATVKIRDWATFYHLLPENPNAAEWMIFGCARSKAPIPLVKSVAAWIGLSTECARYLEFGLIEGGDIYPSYESDNSAVELSLNRRLIEVKEERGVFHLRFEKSECEVRAKQVILALPKGPLNNVRFYYRIEEADGSILRDVSEDLRATVLDTVVGFLLLKCFFLIKDPFWEDKRPANQYAHTVPTRELHYWKTADTTRGVMMLYTDRPGTQFWSDYLADYFRKDAPNAEEGKHRKPPGLRRELPHAIIWPWKPNPKLKCALKLNEADTVETFENNRLLRSFLLYAKEEGADSVTAERVLAVGMRDWGLKPYEAAAHAWRAGSDVAETMKYLAGFSLEEIAERTDGEGNSAVRNLHVCGEAYSDYQGFIEGALRSAAATLEAVIKADKLQRPEDFKSKDGRSMRTSWNLEMN